MNKLFSVKETILYSVRLFVEQPWYCIKLLLLWLLFSCIVIAPLYLIITGLAIYGNELFAPLGNSGFIGIGAAIILIYLLVITYLWTGPIKLLLNYYDTQNPQVSFKEFFHLFSVGQLFKILGLLILYAMIVALGIILLVIPGIYLAIKLQLAIYYAIDTDSGIIDSFKKSYAATTGNFWRILAVDIIAAVLLQLIITLPISYLMGIYVYRKLG